MQVQTGSLIKHIESGIEAEYLAGVPTLEHGLLHLLKTGEGYVFRFTKELEDQFEGVNKEAPVSPADPFAGVTAEDVQKLLALLRQQGGTTAAAVQPAAQVEVEPEPGLDKAPTEVQAEPQAAVAGKAGIPL